MTAFSASEPRVRPLSHLLKGMVSLDPDLASIAVSNLTLDSRKVESGSLFIAMRGNKADGRDFVNHAVNSGAAAVLVENDINGIDHFDGMCLAIPDLRSKVGVIADRFFDHPSSRLFVIGVTGTNGKTSCAFLLTQALNALGKKSGFIGTTGWGFDGNLQKSELTTPDAVTLQLQLSQLVTAGAEGVCLEVSSHALDQRRVEGVEFSSAIFTNLGRDHLDYHKSIERYKDAKFLLFQRRELKSAIINISDPVGAEFAAEKIDARVWTFGNSPKASVYPLKINQNQNGIELLLNTPVGKIQLSCALHGNFNIENLLAVATTLVAEGYSAEQIGSAMSGLTPVEGRMEFCRGLGEQSPLVVIDYAHSPDALSAVLQSIRSMTAGQIWCVFGCGGDRDKGKRSLMGQAASMFSDRTVLTNDNPRSEDPSSILDSILAGMNRPPDAVIEDRQSAIKFAIDSAGAEDTVLIAGKGHENRQLISDQELPFNDREVVETMLGASRC